MRATAAVLVGLAAPLELAELEIPPLEPGQVLVRVAMSGVCHTQLLEAEGLRGPDRFLPHCLGHEGSGEIVEIGSSVTRCKSGDRVILSWMKGPGHDVPGVKYGWNGTNVNAGAITTFNKYTVASENRVTPIGSDLSYRQAALLGCAVPTGMGAVFNTGRVQPGESLVVFGAGGVGLCAIGAGKIAGCSSIVVIDPVESRREAAVSMGATTVLDSDSDNAQILRDLSRGGFDLAIEATGRTDVMSAILDSVHPRGGRAVIIGNATAGTTVKVDPAQFNQGKALLGTWGGDNIPERDFPRWKEFVSSGALPLDNLIGKTFALSDVNLALDELRLSHVTRPLIDMAL